MDEVAIIMLVLDVLAVAVLVYLGVRLYEGTAALWLFPRGEYERARKLYEKMARRGIFPSTKLVARYGVAVCDLQMGRAEQALVGLVALPYDKLQPPMRFAIDLSVASALLQLERDPETMRDRFQRAASFQVQPDILLGLAHAELSLGDVPRAEALYAQAVELPVDGRIVMSRDGIVRRSGAMVEHATIFLHAWYLARTGRIEEAAPLLQEVVSWPTRSWVTDKAEALLIAMHVTPVHGEEEPPSTGAMVVDTLTRE